MSTKVRCWRKVKLNSISHTCFLALATLLGTGFSQKAAAFEEKKAARELAQMGAPSNNQSRTVRFRAVNSSGFYPKVFTLRGRKKGESTETIFATFIHGGRKNLETRFSRDWITIRDIEQPYLRAEITVMFETPWTRDDMRSDDPDTSNYLFYKADGAWVQRPANTSVDVFREGDCKVTDQSWEDGGGFQHQDFFFQVQVGECNATS